MAQPKVLPSVAYLQACFIYDPETGTLTWRERPREHFQDEGTQTRWNTRWAGKPAGSIKSSGHRRVDIDAVPYLAHRVIFKMMTGEEPPPTIDHRFGVPGDNRWEFLRPATHAEQMRNSADRKNAQGDRGVYLTPNKKWRARIKVDSVYRSLGTFATRAEAVAARDRAARELHGAFYRRPRLTRPR